MTFANPEYLFLLLILLPIAGWYIYELRKSDASVQVSDTRVLAAEVDPYMVASCAVRAAHRSHHAHQHRLGATAINQ